MRVWLSVFCGGWGSLGYLYFLVLRSVCFVGEGGVKFSRISEGDIFKGVYRVEKDRRVDVRRNWRFLEDWLGYVLLRRYEVRFVGMRGRV